jgi:alpha-tubulin suppressor-like RCC1 family protein
MTTTSFPTQVPVLSTANTVTKIATTSSGTTAILDAAQTLYVLGNASNGELGDGTTVNKSTPTSILLGSITALESGYANFGAVTGNKLYTWGNNSAYQIGDGTTINKSTPTAISITKTTEYPWKSITQGAAHFAAIRTTDGALFAWGGNAGGQLGDGTTIDKSAPTKIGNNSWSIVTAGTSHTVAIDTTGALYAWGNNGNAALGDGTLLSRSSPVKIGTSSWSSVSAGLSHTTGTTTNGGLWAWGYNNVGQVGYFNGFTTYSTPTQIGFIGGYYSFKQVAASVDGFFSAGITTEGALYTWGLGTTGQLGDNTAATKSSPVKIGTSSWSVVSVGGTHMAAIDSTGALYAWGLGTSGQLGDNTAVSKSSPVKIGTSSWSSVSAGALHTTATDINGNLFTWGSNSTGQIGDGTSVTRSSPVLIPIITTPNWKQLVTNPTGDLTAGITTTGALYTWGLGTSGQLGDNTAVSKSSPVKIGSSSWSSVSAGNSHIAAIDITGALYAWGLGTSGQLGDGTIVTKSSPVKIGTSSWTSVSAGGSHTTATDINGNLYAWGLGTSGQLGDNTAVSKSSPVKIGSSSWSSVSAGASHTAGVTSIGQLYAWGGNAAGQLGDGTTINKSSPVQIGSSSWSSVSAGSTHSTGITSDGKLFAWGNNATGQLGDGTTINKSTPVQAIVTVPNTWRQISYNISAAVAIDATGGLWTWGNGAIGQLGDNTAVNKSSPVKIGSSSWSIVSAGVQVAFGITTAGALYAWGYNNVGQLGDGTTVAKSSPIQIGNNSWSTIAAGNQHAAAIDSTGALYTWGTNSFGSIGDNTTVSKSSPVKIGSSSWVKVAAGSNQAFAIDINGRLYAWGFGNVGQLGDNTAVTKSSPVQIGSSSWSVVTTGAGITIDGSLFTWSANASDTGYLGDGTTIAKSSPVKIGTSSWIAVMSNVGSGSIAAIDTTGALYAWGNNTGGMLGDGTTINKSSPVKIGTSSWSSIGAGGSTTAGITTTGILFTWGLGTSGELGDNTAVSKSSPVFVLAATNPIVSWTSVSAGGSHTAAITTANTLYVWGGNAVGQLGDGTTLNKSTAFKIGATSNPSILSWSSISAGGSHTAAITTANTAYIWGLGTSGQLGDTTVVSKSSPVFVSAYNPDLNAYSSWTVVTAGSSHTAAITTTGKLYTWGGNANGQIGDGTTINKLSAVQIGSSSWSAVSAAQSHTAGITSDKVLYTWGGNSIGQLGDGTTVSKSSPITTTPNIPGAWKQVSNGLDFSLGIRNLDSSLWAWGYNGYGQFGNNTTNSIQSPVQIGLSSWSVVSAGQSHVMAIDMVGRLFAWGGNASGQLGDGTNVVKSSPVLIGTSSWSKISVSNGATSVAIDINGRLFTWGLGTSGQLGDGTTVSKSSPVLIGSNSWTSVSAGAIHMTAIDTTGSLYAWGSNLYGQLGGDLGLAPGVGYSTPTKIASIPGTSTYSWTKISVGQQYAAGITTTGALYAWGLGTSGQLGVDPINWNSVSTPTKVASLNSWIFVATGERTSAGIDTTGALYTWGSNRGALGDGMLGDGTTINKSGLVKIGSSSWTKVFASTGINGTAFFGIDGVGRLFAWGLNYSGMLGDGTTINKSSPVQISVGTSWTTLSAGYYHTLAIDTLGRLYSWGYNGQGQLGDNSGVNSSRSTAVNISGGSSWSSVGANRMESYAITKDGSLYTWGQNANGELGDGTTINKLIITKLGTSSWTIVSGSKAIDINGRLFTWGDNAYGGLGDGTTLNKSSPVQLGTRSWTTVSCNWDRTVAVDTTGNLYTWGVNTYGGLGDGTTIDKSSPVIIQTIIPGTGTFSSWTITNCGASHTVAIDTTGALYAWGYNATGQLGDGTTINKQSPFKIGSSSWSKINSGISHTVAIDTTGALYVWGGNSLGALGDGTTINKSSPVKLGTSSWTSVSAGGSQTAGTTSANTLYTWGYTPYNLASGVNNSSPALVGYPYDVVTTSSFVSVSAGYSTTAAIDIVGNLWTWGYNGQGQLGDITTTSKSAPVQLQTGRSWSAVSAGQYHTAALSTANTAYLWGYNVNGQIGDNTVSLRSSPVFLGIPNETLNINSSWSVVSAGQQHTAAVTTTGKLYTWGLNTSGQLGDGTTINKFSPTQIGSLSWSIVSAGFSHTAGLTTANTLYTWGINQYGQLGDGTVTNRSSPVLIDVYPWTSVKAHYVNTSGVKNGYNYVWGDNTNGVLGDGTTIGKSQPIIITNSKPFTSWKLIATGGVNPTSGGISDDGSLWTWGDNTYGMLGNGIAGSTFTERQTVPQLLFGNSWTILSVGVNQHSAAIDTTGALYTWGGNASGQLGDGTTINKSSPIKIGTKSWSAVSAGYLNTIAIDTTGALYIWGTGNSGALGDGTTIDKSSPVKIGTSSWSFVYGGSYNNFAIDRTGALYAWGTSDTVGALGDGTTINRSSPVKIGAEGSTTVSWTMVTGGHAITNTGRLFGWGYGTYGMIGDGTTVAKSSPVNIIGGSSFTFVNTGGNGSTAIDITGQIFAWGNATSTPAVLSASSLNSVPWKTAIINGTSGVQYYFLSDNTNSVYGYGNNTYGQMGIGTTTSPTAYTSPAAIVTQSNIKNSKGLGWKNLSFYNGISFGINLSDSLYAWGANTNNAFGFNTVPTSRSTPDIVNIAVSNYNIIDVAMGNNTTIAITTDNETNSYLYAWGNNAVGQYGDGSTVTRSSPVLVTQLATGYTANLFSGGAGSNFRR